MMSPSQKVVRELTISGDLNEVGETTCKLPSSEVGFCSSSPSRLATYHEACSVVRPNAFTLYTFPYLLAHILETWGLNFI